MKVTMNMVAFVYMSGILTVELAAHLAIKTIAIQTASSLSTGRKR